MYGGGYRSQWLAAEGLYDESKEWAESKADGALKWIEFYYKKAKLQARIKPTALYSAIDKENSIEFPLDSLHYLYNYYMVCALLSHTYHVTLWLPVMWLWLCDTCDVTLSCTSFYVVSPS